VDQNYLGIHQKKLWSGTTVIFLDESGYSLIPFVARTWALKGEVPALYHSWGSRRKLSVISGIAVKYRNNELDTQLNFRIHPGKSISTKEVIEFFYQLNRQIDGKKLLVWDNLSTHKSVRVKKFFKRHFEFESIYLPPYCPELNPDEGVWNWTKTKDLANACPESGEILVHLVRGSLRKIQRRKSLHIASLKGSELPWGMLLN